MPESSQAAKLAASLVVQQDTVDEEAVRILLALNDQDCVFRLLRDAVSQGVKLTPEAWKLLYKEESREKFRQATLGAYKDALDEGRDAGARSAAYQLTKTGRSMAEPDDLLSQALDHRNLGIAAWLLSRQGFNVERTAIMRWAAQAEKRFVDLAQELENALERGQPTNGRRNFMEGLVDDLKLTYRDNQELQRLLKDGSPRDISDAVHNCLYLSRESLDALDGFARDRAEEVEGLVQLIQEDAREAREDELPRLAGFLDSRARRLKQIAQAKLALSRAQ